METLMKQKEERITDMKARMRDIYLSVSWREIVRTYFKKSVPWFQQKMYGIDGNGGVGGFSPEEAAQLRGALIDLSDRIRRAADTLGNIRLSLGTSRVGAFYFSSSFFSSFLPSWIRLCTVPRGTPSVSAISL